MSTSLALPPAAAVWIDRLGGPRRARIVGASVLAVVVLIGIARWASRPEWVPLYNDIPLETISEVGDQLTSAGIPYRLANGGGELRVASSDVARARVLLARGGMPAAGRPGMELFDQPSWGMTDFTQRINYRRALEGELERTISKMSGVEAAKVHLAIPQTAAFRAAQTPAEASVVLRLRGGMEPSPEVVRGISHLVASSVDGIDAGRVSVLDHTGRLLSSPYTSGSLADAASRELDTRRAVETYLGAKAEQLVSQIAGVGNVRVQVAADINYDRVERTVESVDPESQAVASEQRAEIIPGAEGGAASTNVTASYLNTRTLETLSRTGGSVERLTIAVLMNQQDGGQVWTPEQLANVEGLVRNAVGFDAARGDLLSVATFPFQAPLMEPTAPPSLLGAGRSYWLPGLIGLGLLVTAVLGFVALKKTGSRSAAAQALVAAPAAPELPVEKEREEPEPELQLPVVVRSAQERLRDAISGQVKEEPEIATRALRAWLKEA